MNKIGVEHDGRDRHFFFNSSLRRDAVKRLQVCTMFLVRCTHCVSLVYFSARKRDRDSGRERGIMVMEKEATAENHRWSISMLVSMKR